VLNPTRAHSCPLVSSRPFNPYLLTYQGVASENRWIDDFLMYGLFPSVYLVFRLRGTPAVPYYHTPFFRVINLVLSRFTGGFKLNEIVWYIKHSKKEREREKTRPINCKLLDTVRLVTQITYVKTRGQINPAIDSLSRHSPAGILCLGRQLPGL
jgi:hypothetical protein